MADSEGKKSDLKEFLEEVSGANAVKEFIAELRQKVVAGELTPLAAQAEANRLLTLAKEEHLRAERIKRGFEYALKQTTRWFEQDQLRQELERGLPSDIAKVHAEILRMKAHARREDITVKDQREIWPKIRQKEADLKFSCRHRLVALYDHYYEDEYGSGSSTERCKCLVCGQSVAEKRNELPAATLAFGMREECVDPLILQPGVTLKKIIETLKKNYCPSL